MKFSHIALVAAAVVPGFAECVEQAGTKLAPVSLSMRINADGSPSEVACGPTIVPAICPVLMNAVSRWRFAPGQRDSAPSAIDIWLSLDLVAIRKPGGFSIQATHADVQPRSGGAVDEQIRPETRLLNPPRYPDRENRLGKEAVVIVELSPQPGSPHPLVGQVWVGGKPARPRDPFVKATISAVANWELAAMPAEQLSTCVPVEFKTEAPKSTGAISRPSTAPCVSRYSAGFAPPKLLTDPLTASF